MGWVNKHKMYEADAQAYCDMCETIEPVTHNPKWVDDGRPVRWDDNRDYEWFARCSCCGFGLYFSRYACPTCNAFAPDDDSTLLHCSEPRYVAYLDMQYGGNPHDWTERHKCAHCGTVYDFANGTH